MQKNTPYPIIQLVPMGTDGTLARGFRAAQSRTERVIQTTNHHGNISFSPRVSSLSPAILDLWKLFPPPDSMIFEVYDV